jgi:hypothetical protein
MMKTAVLLSAFCFTAATVPAALAQEPKKESAAAAVKPVPSQEELEKKFTETMTNAVMAGRWCLIEGGKLSPDKEDKYTIASVKKNDDGSWTITAKIEYAGLTFNAPVPVQVKWAGDTAVIVVDNMGLPGTPKYSARVLVFEGTYSGTWNGGGHGGLMHGVVKKVAAEPK